MTTSLELSEKEKVTGKKPIQKRGPKPKADRGELKDKIILYFTINQIHKLGGEDKVKELFYNTANDKLAE